MAKNGPIIIIDDDPDDQEMISRIIGRLNLPNQLRKFFDGEEAMNYFLTSEEMPHIILCDINMPLMNGFELKKNIDAHKGLKAKQIPFVYLTTTANPDHILQAYNLTVQGFFVKGQTYEELKETVRQILAYWQRSEQPG
jgi:CheY-like chemotaxis protein